MVQRGLTNRLDSADDSADDGTVFDPHVAAHRQRVGHRYAIGKFTIVGYVAVRHYHVAAAYPGYPVDLRARHGHRGVLTDDVIVADYQLGVFTVVVDILRVGADEREGIDPVAAPDRSVAGDGNV